MASRHGLLWLDGTASLRVASDRIGFRWFFVSAGDLPLAVIRSLLASIGCILLQDRRESQRGKLPLTPSPSSLPPGTYPRRQDMSTSNTAPYEGFMDTVHRVRKYLCVSVPLQQEPQTSRIHQTVPSGCERLAAYDVAVGLKTLVLLGVIVEGSTCFGKQFPEQHVCL